MLEGGLHCRFGKIQIVSMTESTENKWHRRQEKRDLLLHDYGDFGAGPYPASARSRIHSRIRLG